MIILSAEHGQLRDVGSAHRPPLGVQSHQPLRWRPPPRDPTRGERGGLFSVCAVCPPAEWRAFGRSSDGVWGL
jgi:hypothetical protein